ncbi:MAG: ABC transporter permease [Cardiobacteriaceae bacterium]|nr:ABC transporter permease [Cardiobacteriaceae bacterium]
MEYGQKTSLIAALKIQGRVIFALLMREILTRYGRGNIGFLWLFIEPLLFTLMIVFVRQAIKMNSILGMDVAFILTGYPMILMWRNASNRAIGAVKANLSLMYHRNVRVFDTLFSRVLLEVIGATVAQIGLVGLLIFIGMIDMPADLFYMLAAWTLMAFFALGLGTIICAIAYRFDRFGKIWGIASFLMMPLSGAFFYVHSLPAKAQEFFLWIPMVSGTEMFRHGYFGNTVITHERIGYLIIFDLAMLLFGMSEIRKISKGIEPK